MRLLRFLTKLLLVLVLLMIGILAGMDNSEAVALRFLDWQTPKASVFTWVAAALIVGVVLGIVASLGVNLRAVWRERSARKALQHSEQALEQLKVSQDS